MCICIRAGRSLHCPARGQSGSNVRPGAQGHRDLLDGSTVFPDTLTLARYGMYLSGAMHYVIFKQLGPGGGPRAPAQSRTDDRLIR